MDTSADILKRAIANARARQAEEPAEAGSPGPDEGGRSEGGRDERGFTTTVSKADDSKPEDREPTKQERIAELEAELDRLARERGVAARSNPDRSRLTKLIGRKFIGS